MPPSGLLAEDPERIGSYVLLGRLGAGGMGVVYRAEDPQGLVVALKVIRSDIADDPKFRKLFRREARNAQRVVPFCTAPVLDVNADAEQPYIVTEFVDGPTLSAVVERDGPLPGIELYQLAVMTAVAMIVIHDAGIVHCDLKPSNVLLSPLGPRIIDFGVARAVDATTAATQTGVFGTPAFMAPEQIRRYNSVTPAADVFAWGGMIAYAGTGRRPHGDGRPDVMLYRAVHDEPDFEGLDSGLRPLVAKAMDKDPQRRPSATDVLVELLSKHAPEQELEDILTEIRRGQLRGTELAAILKRLLSLAATAAETTVSVLPPRSGLTGTNRPISTMNNTTVPDGNAPRPIPVPPARHQPDQEKGKKEGTRNGGLGRLLHRRRSRLLAAVGAGALAVAIIWAYNPPHPHSVVKPTYVIGFQGTLTGGNAALGRSSLLGARTAVELANQDPDLPFRLTMKESDDQGLADKGAGAARELIDDHSVVAVIGPTFSGPAEKSILSYSGAGLVAVSPSATGPGLTSLGVGPVSTFFRTVSPDTVQGPQSAKYMISKLSPRGVLVLFDSSNSYGTGLADELVKQLNRIQQQKNLPVTVTTRAAAPGTDYAKLLTDLSSYNLVYYAGYTSEFVEIIKILRQRKFTGTIMSGDGSNSDLLLTGVGGDGAEGVYLTCPCREVAEIEPRSQAVQQFVDVYEKISSGAQPDFYAADAFDATRVVIDVLKRLRGKVSRQSVAHTFGDPKFIRDFEFEGITKKIKFDMSGEVQGGDIFIYQVRDGRRQYIGSAVELARGNG
ncbi:bifunctional serine/threonine-protein kinase/ABC transporter substrate-binding protein [Frankia sp. Cj5]|uniref:bifunctional serine/threonine-protein kinase/ABC transporter substrate-binding protein n=2 Tax=unclassified Frankia TaxID=2632575 RepID=UPI001EF3D8C3|nr:bifunctional serine/threonine-protein kinase/ABC transporter substrate-binding protein [Frankia sp. Cj5]